MHAVDLFSHRSTKFRLLSRHSRIIDIVSLTWCRFTKRLREYRELVPETICIRQAFTDHKQSVLHFFHFCTMPEYDHLSFDLLLDYFLVQRFKWREIHNSIEKRHVCFSTNCRGSLLVCSYVRPPLVVYDSLLPGSRWYQVDSVMICPALIH